MDADKNLTKGKEVFVRDWRKPERSFQWPGQQLHSSLSFSKNPSSKIPPHPEPANLLRLIPSTLPLLQCFCSYLVWHL